jgi:hypothetical protein
LFHPSFASDRTAVRQIVQWFELFNRRAINPSLHSLLRRRSARTVLLGIGFVQFRLR